MEQTFKLEVLFGYCRIEDRLVPRDGKLYGQSRKLDYDRNGNLTRVSEWTDTGAVLFWPEDEPSLWKRIQRFVGWR